jgi:5-methylcytosine-specific restriction enzyme A
MSNLHWKVTRMNLQTFLAPAKVWYQVINDTWTGKAPPGTKRSSQWPKVREEFLKSHPVCECCGGKDALEVHHVEPFHVNPARELDPENLMTLCESKRRGVNCHLFIGHLGNYSRWNPLARLDAKLWAAKLSGWFAEQFRKVLPVSPTRDKL